MGIPSFPSRRKKTPNGSSGQVSILGTIDRTSDGPAVGYSEGLSVGCEVGKDVGDCVGIDVGFDVGVRVGLDDGNLVGELVGYCEGPYVGTSQELQVPWHTSLAGLDELGPPKFNFVCLQIFTTSVLEALFCSQLHFFSLTQPLCV